MNKLEEKDGRNEKVQEGRTERNKELRQKKEGRI